MCKNRPQQGGPYTPCGEGSGETSPVGVGCEISFPRGMYHRMWLRKKCHQNLTSPATEVNIWLKLVKQYILSPSITRSFGVQIPGRKEGASPTLRPQAWEPSCAEPKSERNTKETDPLFETIIDTFSHAFILWTFLIKWTNEFFFKKLIWVEASIFDHLQPKEFCRTYSKGTDFSLLASFPRVDPRWKGNASRSAGGWNKPSIERLEAEWLAQERTGKARDEELTPEPTLTYAETCLHGKISGVFRGTITQYKDPALMIRDIPKSLYRGVRLSFIRKLEMNC